MARTSRWRLLVEPRVQLGLILRIASYWAFSLFAIGLILLIWDIGQGPLGPYFNAGRFNILCEQYLTVAVASLFILPVLLADALRVSNRFAGPIYRVQGRMRELAAGKHVSPVKVRDQDYCVDLANDFNAVLDYVAHLKEEISRLQDKSPVGASAGMFEPHGEFELETAPAR